MARADTHGPDPEEPREADSGLEPGDAPVPELQGRALNQDRKNGKGASRRSVKDSLMNRAGAFFNTF